MNYQTTARIGLPRGQFHGLLAGLCKGNCYLPGIHPF